MDLYYKDKDGEFKKWMDLKEGIWRVANIPEDEKNNAISGKEFNFVREDDLPKAMKIASFIPHKNEISKRIFKYIDGVECYGISSETIFNIIENVITEGE